MMITPMTTPMTKPHIASSADASAPPTSRSNIKGTTRPTAPKIVAVVRRTAVFLKNDPITPHCHDALSLAFHISDRIRKAGHKAIDPTIFINKQFDQQRHLFLIVQRREGWRNFLLIDHHRVIPFLVNQESGACMVPESRPHP